MTPESLAYDIWLVVTHTLREPPDYAVHVPGRNQDVTLRAARPDSHNHVSDIATVVEWVLFTTQLDEENRSATLAGRKVNMAAVRLAALFNRFNEPVR